MSAVTSLIAENLERVRERIARAAARSGREASDITIVAVSKTFPAAAIRSAFEAGLRHFGENRVQEWESKEPDLRGLAAIWHLVGHLQSNKARRAAHLFSHVDSVDSVALAQKLDSASGEEQKKLPVLIEVHLSEEAAKTGVAEPELPALGEAIVKMPYLDLLGLMTVPPYFDDSERARPYFKNLRGLRDRLSRALGKALPILSMGMSHDFEIAIEEGATEIRIGTAIFGERTKQP
jgi:pyridoxal phosphate enzyme (YggS family)